MRIERIQVRNFKAFKNVELNNLPLFSVFIGPNGSGKSTLFDVFGFLHDALLHNVRQALQKRGGFKEVVTRGQEGPIEFEFKFRESETDPLVTYQLSIGLDDNAPVIQRELLKYRRGQHGQPWYFLDFKKGAGQAVTNEEDYGKPDAKMERDHQTLESPDILAIKGLGQFQRFRQVSAFRRLIEDWHVSDFHISEARGSQEAGYAEHLSVLGDNIALVAQYMYEQHPKEFQKILQKMAQRVPGITKVEAVNTQDGRVILRFQDGSFRDPFVARYVSDGTIKMFAYLLLLHDPKPHPLMCVEEPENQLHPELLVQLAEEFRDYADRGGQVFVSTHSPDFVNAVELREIFWLQKRDGYTEIHRADEDKRLTQLVAEGDLPGFLWKQKLYGGLNPA